MCGLEELQILFVVYFLCHHRLHDLLDGGCESLFSHVWWIGTHVFCVWCFVFCVWCLVCCVYVCIQPNSRLLRCVLNHSNQSADELPLDFSVILSTIMTGSFGITLIFFLGFHLSLVAQNRTTIEMGEGDDKNNPASADAIVVIVIGVVGSDSLYGGCRVLEVQSRNKEEF